MKMTLNGIRHIRDIAIAALIGVALTVLAIGPGSPVARAQLVTSATPVQQTPTRADAANFVTTNVTSAATSTLTPNGGEYVYIYEIDVSNCAGASAVTAAAVTTITTTNLSGTPAFTLGSGVAAGLCQPFPTLVYPTGLRAQSPGTAVTFVLPTFATNQTVRLNVTWRSAP